MTLTIHLKKRWITTVLSEAGKKQPTLPWQRGERTVPQAFRDSHSPRQLTLVRA